MPRPSTLLLLAALAGGCSPAPPPAVEAPTATVRVGGETRELPRAQLAPVTLRPGLDALVIDAEGLHLVLLGSLEGGDFVYRRPAGLPAEAESDSWLRLDERWLEAAEVRAELDRSQPDQAIVALRGTFLEGGRPVPVEGELTIRARNRR